MRLSSLVTAASSIMLCVTVCYCESLSSDCIYKFCPQIAWLMFAFILLFSIAFNLLSVYCESFRMKSLTSQSSDYRELAQRIDVRRLKWLVVVFFLLALVPVGLLCLYVAPTLVVAMLLLYALVGYALRDSRQSVVRVKVRDGVLALLYSVFAMLFIFMFEGVLPIRNSWSIVVVICMTVVAALLSANQFIFQSVRLSANKPQHRSHHNLGRVRFIRAFDLYAIHGLIASLCMLSLVLQYTPLLIPCLIYFIVHITLYKYSSTNVFRIKQLSRLTATSSLVFAMLFCSLYVINVSDEIHKDLPVDKVEEAIDF